MVSRKKNGFTLIEVMVAILVLTIAASGTSAFIINSRKNMHIARLRCIALELAENTLNSYASTGVAGEADATEWVVSGNQTFTRTVKIVRCTKGVSKNYDYYEIMVTVDHDQIAPITLRTNGSGV